MSNSSYLRLGSANAFDSALGQISARQTKLATLQENLSSGKRVLHASDDPTGAAQAERALTRIARLQTDQRALGQQKDAITQAESTLGDAVEALQHFRELVVSAGNPAYGPTQRQAIAQQLKGLRDQVFGMANIKDANGLPLFSSLGSALTPFVQQSSPPPDYTFAGLPGQTAATDVSIPFTLDGDRAFMLYPTKDGSFNATYGVNVGQTTTSAVSVATPAAVTGNDYQIQFSVVAGVTQYTVNQVAPPAVVVPATNYVAGSPITFDGLSLTVSGTPAAGDVIDVKPNASVFSVMDQAVTNIGSAANSTASIQAVGQALANLDIGLQNLQMARSQAGELLNRAERIGNNQEARAAQLEDARSRAEDLDMVKGISDFQTQQTGYDAALKSYSQVQRLSLFNYIG